MRIVLFKTERSRHDAAVFVLEQLPAGRLEPPRHGHPLLVADFCPEPPRFREGSSKTSCTVSDARSKGRSTVPSHDPRLLLSQPQFPSAIVPFVILPLLPITRVTALAAGGPSSLPRRLLQRLLRLCLPPLLLLLRVADDDRHVALEVNKDSADESSSRAIFFSQLGSDLRMALLRRRRERTLRQTLPEARLLTLRVGAPHLVLPVGVQRTQGLAARADGIVVAAADGGGGAAATTCLMASVPLIRSPSSRTACRRALRSRTRSMSSQFTSIESAGRGGEEGEGRLRDEGGDDEEGADDPR